MLLEIAPRGVVLTVMKRVRRESLPAIYYQPTVESTFRRSLINHYLAVRHASGNPVNKVL